MPGLPLDRPRPIERLASAAVVIVTATSAFEVAVPRLGALGLHVSSLEATAGAALAAGGAAAGLRALAPWRLAYGVPASAALAVAGLSAALAPAYQGEAWRTCGRLLAAWLVAALVAHVVRTRAQARPIVAVLLATGALVGGIALLELTQAPPVLDALTVFRPGFHVVGGQMRASATFVYPTIASMYLEVVFALGLWFAIDPPAGPWHRRVLAPLVALTLVAAGIVGTFTRAGILAMAASLAVVAGLRYRRRRVFDPALRRLAVLAAVVAALTLLSRSPEVWAGRVRTDTSQEWYGATYTVPRRLTLAPGGVTGVPVAVENTGLLTWQSREAPVFAMSYHWLDAASNLVVEFEGARTPFAAPVAPGDEAHVTVEVRAPAQPGDYVLAWDVVHEGRAWLSTEGVYSPRTAVRVEGVAPPVPVATRGPLPGASVRMPRRELWRAAAAMAADRPLLGVGPGNFRLHYGTYLGLSTWDRRVHANNLYLEAVTGLGVPGLAALLWLMAVMTAAAWRQWRRDDGGSPAAPLLATAVVIAGHGLVDTFLAFTPTYVVFALAAGLAAAPLSGAPPVPHAHRV